MMLEKQRLRMHVNGTGKLYVDFIDDDKDRQVDMLKQDWIDMGSPNTITVTLEPGDLLNEEDQ